MKSKYDSNSYTIATGFGMLKVRSTTNKVQYRRGMEEQAAFDQLSSLVRQNSVLEKPAASLEEGVPVEEQAGEEADTSY